MRVCLVNQSFDGQGDWSGRQFPCIVDHCSCTLHYHLSLISLHLSSGLVHCTCGVYLPVSLFCIVIAKVDAPEMYVTRSHQS